MYNARAIYKQRVLTPFNRANIVTVDLNHSCFAASVSQFTVKHHPAKLSLGFGNIHVF